MRTETPSYYGNVDEVSKKLRKERGVVLHAMDELIQKSVEKHLAFCMDDMNKVVSEFGEKFSPFIAKSNLRITKIEKQIAYLYAELVKLKIGTSRNPNAMKKLIGRDTKAQLLFATKVKKSCPVSPNNEPSNIESNAGNTDSKAGLTKKSPKKSV